jgi:hypothetical protein
LTGDHVHPSAFTHRIGRLPSTFIHTYRRRDRPLRMGQTGRIPLGFFLPSPISIYSKQLFPC